MDKLRLNWCRFFSSTTSSVSACIEKGWTLIIAVSNHLVLEHLISDTDPVACLFKTLFCVSQNDQNAKLSNSLWKNDWILPLQSGQLPVLLGCLQNFGPFQVGFLLQGCLFQVLIFEWQVPSDRDTSPQDMLGKHFRELEARWSILPPGEVRQRRLLQERKFHCVTWRQEPDVKDFCPRPTRFFRVTRKFGGCRCDLFPGVKFNKWPPLKGNEFFGSVQKTRDLRIPLDIQVILEDFSLKPPRKRQQKTIHSKQHYTSHKSEVYDRMSHQGAIEILHIQMLPAMHVFGEPC